MKLTIPYYLHKVGAGFPSPATDYIEDDIDLNSHLITNAPATFIIRVQGKSMTNVGIYHGDLLKVDKKAKTLLEKDMKEAKRMGISEKDFKKMIVSNMMYDLNLNGFTYTPENIQTVIGKGFIPGAIAYNKRAQIWMTNGYSGNK